MNNELSIQLSELAKKLGTSVDQLYAATIRQAKIQLVYEIIHALVFALSTYAMYRLYIYLPDFDSNTNILSIIEMTKATSLIALFILTIAFILSLPSTIKDIFTLYSNPEYWAMQDILASIDLKSDK